MIFKFLIFNQKPSHPAIVPILPIKLEYIENSTFNKKTIMPVFPLIIFSCSVSWTFCHFTTMELAVVFVFLIYIAMDLFCKKILYDLPVMQNFQLFSQSFCFLFSPYRIPLDLCCTFLFWC